MQAIESVVLVMVKRDPFRGHGPQAAQQSHAESGSVSSHAADSIMYAAHVGETTQPHTATPTFWVE
jgi:hypothetical protein